MPQTAPRQCQRVPLARRSVQVTLSKMLPHSEMYSSRNWQRSNESSFQHFISNINTLWNSLEMAVLFKSTIKLNSTILITATKISTVTGAKGLAYIYTCTSRFWTKYDNMDILLDHAATSELFYGMPILVMKMLKFDLLNVDKFSCQIWTWTLGFIRG